jgi:hypothetical protein
MNWRRPRLPSSSRTAGSLAQRRLAKISPGYRVERGAAMANRLAPAAAASTAAAAALQCVELRRGATWHTALQRAPPSACPGSRGACQRLSCHTPAARRWARPGIHNAPSGALQPAVRFSPWQCCQRHAPAFTVLLPMPRLPRTKPDHPDPPASTGNGAATAAASTPGLGPHTAMPRPLTLPAGRGTRWHPLRVLEG